MWDWLTVSAEPGKVQLDSLPHLGQGCVLGVCHCDTARQIRAPYAVSVTAGLFYHDRVAGQGALRSSLLVSGCLARYQVAILRPACPLSSPVRVSAGA